jgi:Putative restriction endonuclease
MSDARRRPTGARFREELPVRPGDEPGDASLSNLQAGNFPGFFVGLARAPGWLGAGPLREASRAAGTEYTTCMAQPVLDDASPLPTVTYTVPRWSPAWALPEVPVPEGDTHDAAIEWLRALLLGWVARSGRDVKVARNLGIRWEEGEARFGFDPDLCLIEPSPDRREPLGSLRLWLPEHAAPILAIEVVSPGHPYKDYVDTPERCAANGVQELWIYDPMLVGPRARGGPYLLQIWRRREGTFERVFAGEGPVHCPLLGAWLRPQASRLPEGARLHLSDDAAGRERWLSAEERARLEARRARINEREARTSEQEARAAEQEARAAEQRIRALLERERLEKAELEQRLHALEQQKGKVP